MARRNSKAVRSEVKREPKYYGVDKRNKRIWKMIRQSKANEEIVQKTTRGGAP